MIKTDKIRDLLLDITAQGPVDWNDIVNAINEANLQPTHPHTWQAVYTIFGDLLDLGRIVRVVDQGRVTYVRKQS